MTPPCFARPSMFSVISVAKSVFEMGSAFDCVPEVALTNVSRSGRAVGAVLVGHLTPVRVRRLRSGEREPVQRQASSGTRVVVHDPSGGRVADGRRLIRNKPSAVSRQRSAAALSPELRPGGGWPKTDPEEPSGVRRQRSGVNARAAAGWRQWPDEWDESGPGRSPENEDGQIYDQ